MYEYIPNHVAGRKLERYHNPKETLEMEFLDLGGYIRVSTPKQTQMTSIENQKRYLYEWAELNKYNLTKCYVDIKSGEYTYLRNELKELLEDVRNGVIRGVLVKEISRTSRDVMDMLELKRKITHYGGFIISLKEAYDSRKDDDEFLLIIYSGLAQKERKTTASRVKVTQIIKAKDGKTNVPLPAFGYKLSDDKQTLVINEETAPTLHFIFEKYIEGWGQLKLAKYLNKTGIKSRRGFNWSSNAIKTVLSNPIYIGTTIYNATTLLRSPDGTQNRVIRPFEEWIVRENTHEPLITIEDFNKVQHIMNEKKEKDSKEWSCDRKYLATGILFCSTCYGKIFGSRYPKKSKGKKTNDFCYRYRCDGRNGKCISPMKYWDMERVDHMILDIFRSLFEDSERLTKALKNQIHTTDEDLLIAEERTSIKLRLEELEKAVNRQYTAYEAEALELHEYKDRLAELREEKQRLINRLDKITERLNKVDTLNERLNRVFMQVRDKLDNIHDLTYEEKISLLNATFEKIFINSDYSIKEIVFKT
ncbi:MAG: preprotein translocase subunit TatB [Clostridiaceae bacterium BRH_c20a]|nr:MAG: preprotein translocase subunit TatB [Clostridiaceae bacterium BRH_c20a]